MKIILLYISILISFGTCTSRNGNSYKPIDTINNYEGKPITTEELETFLRKKIKSMDIPGLSIAIINDSKMVYQNNFGYANKEQNLKVTESTIFEFASLSKSIFAFFVMTFVEEGKLDLDKPLYQYLEYPDIATDERYKKITARMVLSHQSGFPNWREGEDNQQLKIKFDPGTNYLYSGEGYQYLALVLREIENTDWQGLESIFQQRIAKPLNMEHSVFIQTEYTRKNKAQPYDENANPIDWRNNYWYLKANEKFVAPSSLHSEPLDFSKWMIALMNKQLLTKESYGELLKIHSTAKTGQCYTLGFMTLDAPYDTVFLHGGDNEGFTGGYVMDINKKWGFVLVTNSEKGQELTNEMFEFFIEE